MTTKRRPRSTGYSILGIPSLCKTPGRKIRSKGRGRGLGRGRGMGPIGVPVGYKSKWWW